MIENTGIGRYIQCLLPVLPTHGCEVVAWMTPEQARDPRWDYPGIERRILKAPVFSVAEQGALPRAAREARVDLLHVPHVNAPLFASVPLVVTIHDLIPFHYPEAIASPLGRLYFKAMVRMGIHRARGILTVSENTRRDLIDLAHADARAIEAVPLAADARFWRPASKEARRQARERFDLPGRYIVYAGQWKAYKNVDLLLEVMARLDPAAFPDLRLVLIGKEDARVPMRDAIARRGLEGRVVLTGFVSDEELLALYQEATLFAFPSRYEGFGLPPLEAMASGVPVVASDRASIPEVVGHAGLLLAPDRVLEWQEAIVSLCTDPARCERLSRLGRERAREFSWGRTAERTVAVYHRVLGR